MPGDQPHVPAPGPDRHLDISHGALAARQKGRIRGALRFAFGIWREDLEPVPTEHLLFADTEDLASLAIEERHSVIDVEHDDDHAGDVKVKLGVFMSLLQGQLDLLTPRDIGVDTEQMCRPT